MGKLEVGGGTGLTPEEVAALRQAVPKDPPRQVAGTGALHDVSHTEPGQSSRTLEGNQTDPNLIRVTDGTQERYDYEQGQVKIKSPGAATVPQSTDYIENSLLNSGVKPSEMSRDANGLVIAFINRDNPDVPVVTLIKRGDVDDFPDAPKEVQQAVTRIMGLGIAFSDIQFNDRGYATSFVSRDEGPTPKEYAVTYKADGDITIAPKTPQALGPFQTNDPMARAVPDTTGDPMARAVPDTTNDVGILGPVGGTTNAAPKAGPVQGPQPGQSTRAEGTVSVSRTPPDSDGGTEPRSAVVTVGKRDYTVGFELQKDGSHHVVVRDLKSGDRVDDPHLVADVRKALLADESQLREKQFTEPGRFNTAEVSTNIHFLDALGDGLAATSADRDLDSKIDVRKTTRLVNASPDGFELAAMDNAFYEKLKVMKGGAPVGMGTGIIPPRIPDGPQALAEFVIKNKDVLARKPDDATFKALSDKLSKMSQADQAVFLNALAANPSAFTELGAGGAAASKQWQDLGVLFGLAKDAAGKWAAPLQPAPAPKPGPSLVD